MKAWSTHFSGDSIDTLDLQRPLDRIRGSNGETLLHFAVLKNKLNLFVELLEAGCELDVLDDEGNHLVHYVQSVDMLNLIIERHPDNKAIVHRTNSDGYSVLHKIFSLRMEYDPLTALVERVIECGADVNQLNNKGESAVFMIGNCTALDILRKYDVKLDIVNSDGETALERHLSHKNAWIVRELLKLLHNEPMFKEHAHKYLSLMMNSNRDFFSVDYQPFLEKYSDTTKVLFDSVYRRSREETSRLFTRACSVALNFIAEKFLEFDYDLDYNVKDEYGCTPIVALLSYMEEPNVHLVKRLLEKNVDLESRNQWGREALLSLVWNFSSAKWYGHGIESVQLLLDHGASVNLADTDGNTPLHLAIARGEWELVEMLVRNGGDLTAKNNAGKTPIEMGSIVEQELFSFVFQVT